MTDLSDFLVHPENTLRDILDRLERNHKGIVLVVDQTQKLLGTITDGDIRRTVLAGFDLQQTAATLVLNRKEKPITAPAGTSRDNLLHMMNQLDFRQIPLVDAHGRVVDLALLSELVKERDLPIKAIVMAGGYGTRLRPLTENMPKPMLPIGDRPLLERLIDQLREAGIRKVNLTTHYKSDVISDYFGNGDNFGVNIQYVEERRPLGTAGALRLLDESDEPLLVINGDILTRIDFRSLLAFHQDQDADMTVGVRQYEFKVPYGVIQTRGCAITGVSEKPVIRHFINAGVYLINPDLRQHIPDGCRYDMPDLINQLIVEKRRVVSFPILEYWLDIGQMDDYHKAQADVRNGTFA